MSADVACVLRNAKALIDTPEKWRRPGNRFVGQYCVLTTLPPVRECEAMRYLCESIGVQSRGEIADWNDAPERTHEEVMAAFDAAIALAEAEGV